jgi:hypothetical protein
LPDGEEAAAKSIQIHRIGNLRRTMCATALVIVSAALFDFRAGGSLPHYFVRRCGGHSRFASAPQAR